MRLVSCLPCQGTHSASHLRPNDCSSKDSQSTLCMTPADFAAMFSSFFDGDLSNDFGGMGGDAGLADVFGSLKELMDGMGGSFPIQTMQASAAPGAATAAASGDADAEAAAKLFASLFEGTSDSFATFLNGGGNGGAASSMFASFMSGSDSGSASSGSGGSASQQPRNNLLDSLSTLMGGRASGLSSLSSLLSSSTGSASGSGSSSQTSASHFAAVLGPVAASSASTRALLDSLSAAIDQADSLFDGPDLQDLFGGGLAGLDAGYMHCSGTCSVSLPSLPPPLNDIPSVAYCCQLQASTCAASSAGTTKCSTRPCRPQGWATAATPPLLELLCLPARSNHTAGAAATHVIAARYIIACMPLNAAARSCPLPTALRYAGAGGDVLQATPP